MPIQMFDDGHEEFQQSVKNFGEAVGGLLTQRLHKKQFEDFMAGPTKDFRDNMTHAQDLLMDAKNPEASSQGMQMLKGALETYMDEGARYADNPIIQQRVAQTFKMNMDFLNMEFKQKFEAQKNERAAAKAKQDTETHAQDMLVKQSQVGLNKAKADQATAAGKKASGEAGGEPQLFSGKPGSIEPMQDDQARVGELWTRIENTIDRPNSEAQRKAVEFGMEDIRNQMAAQKLAEMAGRGEIRAAKPGDITSTARPWDVFNSEDKAAVAGTIDPAEVRNRYVMEKAKSEASYHGIKPEAVEDKYGVVVDPTKANAFRPLQNPVSSENLGKVLFGVAGWDRLRDAKSKARPRNLEEAAARLPDSVDEVHGPIADAFKKFELPEGVNPSTLKSPEDVKDIIRRQGLNIVTAVIGNNAPSSKLDEGMRNNRMEAMNLVNAMVDKYSEEVFMRVTGKKKASTTVSEAEAAEKYPMLGIAARRVGQVTRGVLKPATDKVKGIIKDFQED